MAKLRVALIQLAVGLEKTLNLQRAALKVKEAALNGAQVIALPECFNSPYGTNYFNQYAEGITGNTANKLSMMAKESKVYLIGGSFPERDGDSLYNTCTVWNPQGELIAKHRKMHLFDIDIPGGIKFQESETLVPGNSFTTFEHPVAGLVGIGICYDMRFAEMAQIYRDLGCKVIFYPGAFNMTTGPVHWELLQRARALDNQLYVATVSPARDETGSYIAWGHSSIVNPWGEVIATTDHDETIVYGDLDFDYLIKTRTMIPLAKQRRQDKYKVVKYD